MSESTHPSDPTHSADPGSDASGAYTVLARKYRPQDFDALIGQESLVQILSNAFERERIAHAFMLTGVRGVGKTTTARIIAKGLNCLAGDGPTIKPCGSCENCVAIAASRHVDVLEMDAASRTGIDDIREITESVRYRAAQARYKVYIIDEVHMLSKAAFNGLLKTLEEPPEHVKFILATTDIHKVPVTVLSRCQRFDLRRVGADQLIAHLSAICAAEAVSVSEEALALVARASEGSVRDSLSLLDQAISHGAGDVTGETVRDMLGLAERGRIFALFEAVMRGEPAQALAALQQIYVDGADPVSILKALAEVTHLVTLVRVAPERAEDPSLPPADQEMARELAEKVPMRALSRAWQMLLKGIEETARAPSALAAAEMVIIRLTHVAELPSPEELIKKLTGGEPGSAASPPVGSGGGGGAGPSARAMLGGGAPLTAMPALRLEPAAADPAPLHIAPAPAARAMPRVEVAHFDALIALVREKRDMKLLVDLERYVRPGPIEGTHFEFTPTADAPPDLAARLGQRLTNWTGARWVVSIAQGHGAKTLAELRQELEDGLRAEAMAHPLVAAALAAFPGAELRAVRDLSIPAGGEMAEFGEHDALVEDDLWDDEEEF
ncbi:MAG: DNA polymerase III subunit gamma/tau [Neomegalonema sp.]|nr:DNA polymerase III subunit gamma/tau [Neomegalonema sp.]